MKIAILRERAEGESRVAATPETVTKLIGLGAEVSIEAGAGTASRLPDDVFKAAGATIVASASAAVKGADVVLVVRRPEAGALAGVAKGALVIGIMDPHGNDVAVGALAGTGASAFAMEFMPRITRAQVMDVLSSQANLAGYQSVIDAASVFDRAMPMMMTAAGTVRPAKVFVMGAGVAGLQAIATAKRLGAVVSATDVRPASKEQVESLGGKFIAVEDEEFKQAETAGGYAKEMSKEYQAKQAELTASHIAKQDIVITTALIPGRPAPRLISKAMVESMSPGSVIVDLAAERGGNCEMTQPGKVVEHQGVIIVGHVNMAGRIATTASQLYARNLLAFLDTLIDKKEKVLAVNWDDELVKATLLTRDGAVVHPNFAGAAAAKPQASAASPAAKPAARKSAAASDDADKPVVQTAAAKRGAASKSGGGGAAASDDKPTAPARPAKSGAASKAGAAKPTGASTPAAAKKPAAGRSKPSKSGDA